MRPLISDATMFAAQRGRNRDRSTPIQSAPQDYRLPGLDEFDPRNPPEDFPARAIIWGAAICLAFASILIGAVLS